MRQFVRPGLLALIIVVLAGVAKAQTPPKGQTQGKAAAPAPAQAPAPTSTPPPRPAILDQVLATVNGESITRGELFEYLGQFSLPPGNEQDWYKKGLEGLVNHKLVLQYLVKQKIPVTEKEIDALFAGLVEELKKDGREIGVALASVGMTTAQVRDEMKKKLLWQNYIKLVATDPVLKKYVAEHKDVFNRTQVRASHIVVRVEEDAPAAEKQKVKARLAAIKAEIESKKISFAEAADKYSEDEVNKEKKMGGDLGYFTRRGQFEPNFSAAAFALKLGAITPEPVETPYGFHLIQATDRKDGTPVDFEQNKLMIQQEYAADIQERIVLEMRKTAKIEIKPMPADLFPKAPPASPAETVPPDPTKAATKPK